jgi:DNA-binding transcriptional LysR family regulator
MTELDSLIDLRLVIAIAETGSIGTAATQLHMTQPSASQRLAVLERRLGIALVDRDTTGARLTPAGELFTEHGQRAIDLIVEGIAQARSPGATRLRIGTISSLAPAVFPAVERLLPGLQVEHATNHGRQLTMAVADGSLDAAVIGLEPGESPATGVRRTKLGRDPIVLVGRVDARRTRTKPLAGHTVVVATYGHDFPVIAAKVARLGAEARDAASTATAVAMARQQRWLAAVPRTTAVSLFPQEGEVRSIRLGLSVPIWLITKGLRSQVLVDRAAAFARAMSLR